MKKIKILIAGNKNEIVPTPCGWGPDVSCGPSEDPTTIEMYEKLKSFLESTDVKDKFEMEFIDINKDDLSNYPNEQKIIEKGRKLPITFIAGKPAFSGKVDEMKMYLTLKRL